MAGWEGASSCRKPWQKGPRSPELGWHHWHPTHNQTQEPHQIRNRGGKSMQICQRSSWFHKRRVPDSVSGVTTLSSTALPRTAELSSHRARGWQQLLGSEEPLPCRDSRGSPSLGHTPALWAAGLADRQIYPDSTGYYRLQL